MAKSISIFAGLLVLVGIALVVISWVAPTLFGLTGQVWLIFGQVLFLLGSAYGLLITAVAIAKFFLAKLFGKRLIGG